jgi:hypothetical protein
LGVTPGFANQVKANRLARPLTPNPNLSGEQEGEYEGLQRIILEGQWPLQ